MTTETVPTMLSLLGRAFTAVLVLSVGACVAHEPRPVFRASVLIDDRGISIPLPPPSLYEAPQQEVEVEGEVVGLDDSDQGLVVRILDTTGGSEVEVALAEGTSTFHAHGLAIDLTNHCLDVWLEDDEGNEGDHQLFRAEIDRSGQNVLVLEGCE